MPSFPSRRSPRPPSRCTGSCAHRAIRAPANLNTCSVVAVNVETGKMAWYFQTSPNDTHDWDSTQPTVLVDGMFGGKPRKLAMQASRNGYFFVLDRTTGEHLLTMKFSDAANWAAGINANGQPERNPEKDNTIAGSLVSPDNEIGRASCRKSVDLGGRRIIKKKKKKIEMERRE